MVDASFMQTLWNMNPISSGCELAEGTKLLLHILLYSHQCCAVLTDLYMSTQYTHSLWCAFPLSGFLTGGHVLRLFHGHMDECLAIATPEEGEEKRR